MSISKTNIIYCLIILSILVSGNVFSQNIKAEVNRNRIFIGEQIQLKLSVVNGKNGTSWFQIPDSINHIEVVSKGKIDTVPSGNYTNYSQTITLTSFDSGRWQFPALTIAGINQITLPITIDVLPVDVSKMQDYHEIRDIEEVELQSNWWIIAMIAAITLLSIAIIFYLIYKKKKVPVSKPLYHGNLSPLEWALGEIDKLNKKEVQSPQEIKKYYSDLNNISRTFFDLQLQQNVMRKTTDEWMLNLQPIEVDNDTKTSFFQFLRMADTVKFAKFLPSVRENEDSVEVIKQMLNKVSLLHSNLYTKYQPQ